MAKITTVSIDDHGNEVYETIDLTLAVSIPEGADPALVEKAIEAERERDAIQREMARERAAVQREVERQRSVTVERMFRSVARLVDGRAALDAQVEADVRRSTSTPRAQTTPTGSRGTKLEDWSYADRQRILKGKRPVGRPGRTEPKPEETPLERMRRKVGLGG